METFAQGLAANLFAAPMPPTGSASAGAALVGSGAGSAPAGVGLAGLFGEVFSPGVTKSTKIEEFLGVLDASAPPLDQELKDLTASPETLVEFMDRAPVQPAEASSATLVLANVERLSLRGAGAVGEDAERTIQFPAEDRAGPLQRFVRPDVGPSVDIVNDANPKTVAAPTDKAQIADLSGRAALSEDGLDLSRRFEPQRFEAQRNEFLTPALSANKYKIATPQMAVAFADKMATEPGPIVRDDNLALIQTLSLANERAASAITMSPLSEAATKPAAQIVAAITSRGADASIEIRLDPPELGRVMIDFEGRGGDIIRATVAAEAPDTLELMRRNIDILQRELEKSGLENIDLQFREHGAQSDEKFGDEPFGAGRQHDDAVGIEMNDPSNYVAALSLDGRLDRLL